MFLLTGLNIRMNNINHFYPWRQTKWMAALYVESIGSKVRMSVNNSYQDKQNKWFVS